MLFSDISIIMAQYESENKTVLSIEAALLRRCAKQRIIAVTRGKSSSSTAWNFSNPVKIDDFIGTIYAAAAEFSWLRG